MRMLPPVRQTGDRIVQLPKSFDAESVALMSRVCCDAWWEIKSSYGFPSIAAENATRSLLALRVMEAVGQGQRDPEQLRVVALMCQPTTNEDQRPARPDQARVKESAGATS
jgi:hypothetical protein